MVKNFKIFNLTLTNSKVVFDETLKNNTDNLLDLTIKIKNALKIVHRYHIFKRKIVFVGNPLHINSQLSRMFRKTRHVFIPGSAWVAGHMTNKKSRPRYSKGRYGSTKLFSIYKLKRKSSLVVVIDKLRDSVAHNEFHSAKTPIISLNSGTKMLDETSVVKVPAKLVLLKSNLETFMFYSLLLKIFKRGKRKNQIFPVHRHLYLMKKVAEKQKRAYARRWRRKRRRFRKKHKSFYRGRKNYNAGNFSKTKQPGYGDKPLPRLHSANRKGQPAGDGASAETLKHYGKPLPHRKPNPKTT